MLLLKIAKKEGKIILVRGGDVVVVVVVAANIEDILRIKVKFN